jgi:hypothetical protein
MILIFIPYYHPDTKEFRKSLDRQTIKFREIRRDRKRDGIYWSEACNDFYKQVQTFRGIKDNDVICIMNNDISFSQDLFSEGSKVKQGEVLIPKGQSVGIDWENKRFYEGGSDTFPGRTFFMTYKDFIQSGGFSKFLPHYLSDYDFGIRQIKKGLKIKEIDIEVFHSDHPKEQNPFTKHSPDNPFYWTVFLLKHFNRYFFINFLKVWVTTWRLSKGLRDSRFMLTEQGGI